MIISTDEDPPRMGCDHWQSPKQEGQLYVVESGTRGIGAAQIDQELVVSRMPGHGHFQEPSQPLG